ncbi:MAG: RraA family protein, partial [Chloroflexota bacterium]
ELMSVRARHLGAVGAVMNGYSRDTHAIVSMGFPVFSYGPYAQDQAPRGKVLDFRVPIKMGSVHINPGDIIFGDIDGVCVIPQEAEKDVFTKALEKARGEKVVRKAIENGMSAADAFRTYGIL